MKYIITESKLDQLIFRYLDNKLDGIKPIKGKYSDVVFGLPDETLGVMGLEKPDTLFIDSDFFMEIKLMFSMDTRDVFDLIKRYVESRYNLKVNTILFGEDQRII